MAPSSPRRTFVRRNALAPTSNWMCPAIEVPATSPVLNSPSISNRSATPPPPTSRRQQQQQQQQRATKPFLLSDLAAAALANPRPTNAWADKVEEGQGLNSEPSSSDDDDDDDNDSLLEAKYNGTGGVSTAATSAFPTPFSSQPSSCALTPSSSSEGYCRLPSPSSSSSPSPVNTLSRTVASNHARSTTRPSLSRELPALPVGGSSGSSLSSPSSPRKVSTTSTTPPHSAGVVSPSSPPPRSATSAWSPVDFSLKLFFTSSSQPTPQNTSNTSTSASSSSSSDHLEEHSLPPAFFPSARISFSPRLRVTSPQGLPYSSLGGMHLGVTGMCEILDPKKSSSTPGGSGSGNGGGGGGSGAAGGRIISKRMIADFCIDLTSGLAIWKRDAEKARKAANGGRDPTKPGEEERLPPGTYVLPLSMKVPNCERLIYYTMSIALFSSSTASNGTPRRLKVYSIPFDILPSTLPTLAPELPVLTHDHRQGVFASLMKSLSAFAGPAAALSSAFSHVSSSASISSSSCSSPSSSSTSSSLSCLSMQTPNSLTSSSSFFGFGSDGGDFSHSSSSSSCLPSSHSSNSSLLTMSEAGYHIVIPSLPTSHFSPGAHASIPVSLRIIDRPLEPVDLYLRLAIVRKTYVRESPTHSLAQATELDWGMSTSTTTSPPPPEEMMMEPYLESSEEITSRWGWVPYSSRPGADPNQRAEVLIQDIQLPLSGVSKQGEINMGWNHGYSTQLDIEPTNIPDQIHGVCSWFSPVFRTRPPILQEYNQHVHVSSRFFLEVQIGFAQPGAWKECLFGMKVKNPEMELPQPNSFTKPKSPSHSLINGQSLTDPFPPPPSTSSFTSSSSSSGQSSCGRNGGGGEGSSRLAPNPPTPASFPGKIRELVIPITIGSVAEPTLACISERNNTHASGGGGTGGGGNGGAGGSGSNDDRARRSEREEREERGEDVRTEWGEGPDGAWLCPPPEYKEALRSAPAYGSV